MKPRKANYIVHRWLGLIVSLQLLAWSIGGFMFSVLDLDNVRGERDIASTPFEPLNQSTIVALPETLRSSVRDLSSQHQNLATVALIDRGVGPSWEIRSASGDLLARFDDKTGETLSLISEQEAGELAKRDFAHSALIKSVELIKSDPPIEYRNGDLPAYRVELDHAKHPRLYIDARTGQIVARRNRAWRTFDFFWMLHTMDYSGRDNFNHPLLTVFSLLAVVTAGTGVMLWGWRAMPCRRRRLSPSRTIESTKT